MILCHDINVLFANLLLLYCCLFLFELFYSTRVESKYVLISILTGLESLWQLVWWYVWTVFLMRSPEIRKSEPYKACDNEVMIN